MEKPVNFFIALSILTLLSIVNIFHPQSVYGQCGQIKTWAEDDVNFFDPKPDLDDISIQNSSYYACRLPFADDICYYITWFSASYSDRSLLIRSFEVYEDASNYFFKAYQYWKAKHENDPTRYGFIDYGANSFYCSGPGRYSTSPRYCRMYTSYRGNLIRIECYPCEGDHESWSSDKTLEAMELIDSKCEDAYPPVIDRFTAYPEQLSAGEQVNFVCDAHDSGPTGSEHLIFKFDVNSDGTTDHEELGVLIDQQDDPFKGKKRVDVLVRYNRAGIFDATCTVVNVRNESVTSNPIAISVTDSSMVVIGQPHLADDSETAVIPAHEAFPATYTVQLLDNNGAKVINQQFTASIDNDVQARLDGNGVSGSEIELVTNSEGEAEFTYTYLGLIPKAEPIEDEIIIQCRNLNLKKTVAVSIGLKLKMIDLGDQWDTRTQTPRTMGMRILVEDGFRPNLDLKSYITELRLLTGQQLGVEVATDWPTRPQQGCIDRLNNWIKEGLSDPPDNELFNGKGVIDSIGGTQFIVHSIDETQPGLNVGSHFLPAIVINTIGPQVFEVRVTPIIISEESSGQTPQYAGTPSSEFFVTEVFGAESTFQSVVCSFQPTDADQFLMKTIFLDCPLLSPVLENMLWTAGAEVTVAVLTVQEISNLICDFMQGNITSIASTLSSKYLSHLDDMRSKGLIELTDFQMGLLRTGLVTDSIKRMKDAYNEALKHFPPQESGSSLSARAATSDEWPESITLDDFRSIVVEMNAGLLCGLDMGGRECIVVLSAGEVVLANNSQDLVAAEDEDVHVYLSSSGIGPLSVTSREGVEIFHYQKTSASQVSVKHYAVNVIQEETSLFMNFDTGDTLEIDRGADGDIDETLMPETRIVALPTDNSSSTDGGGGGGGCIISTAAFTRVELTVGATQPTGLEHSAK